MTFICCPKSLYQKLSQSTRQWKFTLYFILFCFVLTILFYFFWWWGYPHSFKFWITDWAFNATIHHSTWWAMLPYWRSTHLMVKSIRMAEKVTPLLRNGQAFSKNLLLAELLHLSKQYWAEVSFNKMWLFVIVLQWQRWLCLPLHSSCAPIQCCYTRTCNIILFPLVRTPTPWQSSLPAYTPLQHS